MPGYIFDDNFLLDSSIAQTLYHQYVKDLPIIDYHCHLNPQQIATNHSFANLTDIWLSGDHYKWRALRTLGVPEHFITGNASDEEKFIAWAEKVPQTIRNPLFHWTHLELKNVFGIQEYLHAENALDIYQKAGLKLEQPTHSTQAILQLFRVEYVGTTDEPWDSLEHHRNMAAQKGSIRMLPSFRPDKALLIQYPSAFKQSLRKLEETSGVKIESVSTLLDAIHNRVRFFHENGCRLSDHGLWYLPPAANFTVELEKEFEQFLQNPEAQYSNPDAFLGYVLLELCRLYHQYGWVQQFHLGPIRNNNTRLNKLLGADSGFDSIGDFSQALPTAQFLDQLDITNQLAKTILYNINPADNEIFASMLGNFNDGSARGKIQFGSGWWFLDQKDGMEKQLNALSNMGLISTFVGMITDSRSFLSFPRHEYFRRIICNLFADEMNKGLLPNDEKWIGSIVKDIAYYNAKSYFNC
jgi:glucuronate isomerase